MWLELVDGWFAGLDRSDPLIEAAHFFIYDTGKIFALLLGVVFLVSLLRSYFPIERVRDYLANKSLLLGHIMAAIFGFVTPFCSCSAIPLFIGFLQARIPLGVVFSYLISAPMNNEIAFVLILGLFGWKVALLYTGLGLLVAVVAGIVLGKMKLEKEILIEVKPIVSSSFGIEIPSFMERAKEAWNHTLGLFKKIAPFVLVGIGLGAFIHGYVPSEFVLKWAGGDSWYAVPLAVLIGAPMYNNAVSIIPLVEVLINKGMLFGTALSFMMATSTFSLPEGVMLKRLMSWKLLALFYGITALGIITNGYLFNFILH
ncbi:permease [Wolinella succinogenes]|uniref:permease n=1 Tax=Wolinella succinogenes TaxID=844 RepID=UPI002408FAA7|nr:permease [Wolinella succinogenes]